jgi:enoyl-CoA hydratase/carnithine racemase
VAARVIVSRAGAVATVLLDNPGRKNAITLGMWGELFQLFSAIAADTGVHAVLLRGAVEGGAFSAGADVSEFPEVRGTSEQALAAKERTHAALEAIASCPVPVLALIDGPCVGAGLEIALCADLRLASDRSTFALPVVRLSSSADLGDIQRLAQAAGPALAAELLLSAAAISAERAYASGLLNWTGPAEVLDAAAQEIVTRVVAAGPRAVRVAKQGLRMVMPSVSAATDYEEAVRRLVSGSDFQEGTRAFVEHRSPVFTGH